MASAPVTLEIPDEAVRRWRELLVRRAARRAGRCSCGCRCDVGRPTVASPEDQLAAYPEPQAQQAAGGR